MDWKKSNTANREGDSLFVGCLSCVVYAFRPRFPKPASLKTHTRFGPLRPELAEIKCTALDANGNCAPVTQTLKEPKLSDDNKPSKPKFPKGGGVLEEPSTDQGKSGENSGNTRSTL